MDSRPCAKRSIVCCATALVALALGIALGWSLIQVATGVSALVGGLLYKREREREREKRERRETARSGDSFRDPVTDNPVRQNRLGCPVGRRRQNATVAANRCTPTRERSAAWYSGQAATRTARREWLHAGRTSSRAERSALPCRGRVFGRYVVCTGSQSPLLPSSRRRRVCRTPDPLTRVDRTKHRGRPSSSKPAASSRSPWPSRRLARSGEAGYSLPRSKDLRRTLRGQRLWPTAGLLRGELSAAPGRARQPSHPWSRQNSPRSGLSKNPQIHDQTNDPKPRSMDRGCQARARVAETCPPPRRHSGLGARFREPSQPRS